MPEESDDPTRLIAYLDRIGRALRRCETEAATAVGLSVLQLKVLQYLAQCGKRGATVGFLAQEYEVSEPTISDSLQALTKKKLAERFQHSTDRRVRLLRITPAGETLLQKIVLPVNAILGRLPAETAERLQADLHLVVAILFEASLLQQARICRTCAYFAEGKSVGSVFCRLLQQELPPRGLKTDCPDHVYRSKPNKIELPALR